ncbi:hypothetical protein ACJMK2_001551, partial [Sinanodonta woodiana]
GYGDDASISREHMNHARLNVALVTVCAKALRDILLTYVPKPCENKNKAIQPKAAKSKKKICTKTKKGNKPCLDNNQHHVVHPDPFDLNAAIVDTFDITMLYTRIRKDSTLSTSFKCWGKDPEDEPSRDRSIGASVERIRLYRNTISHSMDGKKTKEQFDDYWSKIDAVLDDIENELGTHGYRKELQKQRIQ